jgi:hypothetical protein
MLNPRRFHQGIDPALSPFEGHGVRAAVCCRWSRLASGHVRNVVRWVAFVVAVVVVSGCGLVAPEPPESLRRAATDPQWAQAELDKIINERKTTGVLFTPDNGAQVLTSSEQGKEFTFAREMIRRAVGGDQAKHRLMQAAAAHVETKAAAVMTSQVRRLRGACDQQQDVPSM